MGTRRFLAAIIAPVAGVVIGCAGFAVTVAARLDRTPPSLGWQTIFEHWVFPYLIIGLPLAYLAEVIALSIYRRVGPTGEPRLRTTMTIASAIGALLMLMVWTTVSGLIFGVLTIPAGAIGGAAAGVVYWVIGRRRSRPEPTAR